MATLVVATTMMLGACGGSSSSDPASVQPTIVSVKQVDGGVQVRYRASGADGGEWPVLNISVKKADGVLPPSSEYVRPIEEEGAVVVAIEAEPNEDLIVYGSVFYQDGRRVHLPEKHFRL